ncbi:MAG: hypothetical protein ACI9AR_000186 [Flavobacteriaceae bacterium]|jgi:hypothetical protein
MKRIRIIFYLSFLFILSHFLGLSPLFEDIAVILIGIAVMYLSGYLLSRHYEGGNHDGVQKSFTDNIKMVQKRKADKKELS